MTEIDYPIMTCPVCGHEETDYDGFGCLACEKCGWCSHPAYNGGVCGICGKEEKHDKGA